MMAGYWTVWAAALLIGMATGQRITLTQCNTMYECDFYQDLWIEKGIRRRVNATSLVECLLFCHRFSVSNFFFNQATQDCICPLGEPVGLYFAPGYTYHGRPGLIYKWVTEAINASSQDNGEVGDSVCESTLGIDTFLYFAMVEIWPDISTFTKDIWFRDSNRNWMTRADRELGAVLEPLRGSDSGLRTGAAT
ncbi:uncharacterized protein LOC125378736 [Haliotis rufescens]|uniref:uncharacterized protein LOC125378736 n=1 Tax=Haliotis rufescens TaxID=6454 RepID=UPI00201F57F0|nr:uncharacterized protein LOC125378736 [Haliotis rufescens]